MTFSVDTLAVGTFAFATLGLLGSPGPAIAALVAVARAQGFRLGVRFYLGLQIGVAIAAALSALGLASLLVAVPEARLVMTVIAIAYLLYIAFKIATAPVGEVQPEDAPPKRGFFLAGIVVGVVNPKAYFAFASLMVPSTLVIGAPYADTFVKWAVAVLVVMAVDIVWLCVGVALGRASLPAKWEKRLNIVLALMIVAAAAVTVL